MNLCELGMKTSVSEQNLFFFTTVVQKKSREHEINRGGILVAEY